MAYVQKPLLNTHTDMSSEVRDLNFCLRLYLHYTWCIRAAEALASPHICADLPEPLLLTDMISTNNLYTLYLVYTSSQGSGESAHMSRLARGQAACRWDKYRKLERVWFSGFLNSRTFIFANISG